VTIACRSAFEQRMRATLVEDGTRIPVILGLCGTGRTRLLHLLQAELPAGTCQYVNVERTATTPERFLKALTAASPFPESRAVSRPSSPREAFDAVLGFLSSARCADGSRATFLLDEVMEFRTFESFPGLREALPELLAVLAAAPNRFALTSRYIARSERAMAEASPHFLLAPIQGLGADEVQSMLNGTSRRTDAGAGAGAPVGAGSDGVAAAIVSLTGGRPAYARALVDTMNAGDQDARHPLAALAAAFDPGGRLSFLCGHGYELRLHRARGYGALKAILEILAESEPLTLTEISQRLGRTPGSTKDYLSWLDDVDLVSVSRKRYRFRDPLMRVWCRLHCRTDEPAAEDIGREVRAYAEACGVSEARDVARG
jgi:hypothetical protein